MATSAAGAGLLLAAGFAAAASAAVPLTPLPDDETGRAWHATFTARLDARVVPHLKVDAELASRVSRLWDSMVQRLTGGKGSPPTPLEQYPLLSFVDDRFLVMKVKDVRGKDTFVVRADESQNVPTLSSTLSEYLGGVVYPSLQGIAEEERQKMVEHPAYEPRLEHLSAQNPYLHGLPIRVPEMGPFKNRIVAFSGIAGRLTPTDTARFDDVKWKAGSRRVVGVIRNYPWGVAVERADLVEGGAVVCRYRLVREVAAVKDSFVGEGRQGVLLRQPRLGPVLEVSGCLADCEDAASWTRIFPEPGAERPPLPGATRRPRPPGVADPARPSPGRRAPSSPCGPPS
jgi:hypothetical protein